MEGDGGECDDNINNRYRTNTNNSLDSVGDYVLCKVCSFLDTPTDLSRLSRTCKGMYLHVRNLPLNVEREELLVDFPRYFSTIRESYLFTINKNKNKKQNGSCSSTSITTSSSTSESEDKDERLSCDGRWGCLCGCFIDEAINGFQSVLYWCKQGVMFEFKKDCSMFLRCLSLPQLHICRIKSPLFEMRSLSIDRATSSDNDEDLYDEFDEMIQNWRRSPTFLHSQLYSWRISALEEPYTINLVSLFHHSITTVTSSSPSATGTSTMDFSNRLRSFDNLTVGGDVLKPIKESVVFSPTLHRCRLEWGMLKDLSPFKNVHTLYLRRCSNVTDVSSLCNVHTLHLVSFPSLTDVHPLKNVHTLTLSHCENVQNVQSLGRVHSLKIVDCNGIEDVAALSSVNTLSIHSCLGVSNVSCLRNNLKLDLPRCKLTDISPFSSAKTLRLKHGHFSHTVPLANVHHLDLSGNLNIVDVSPLANVHTLILAHCSNLKDVSALGHVHHLDLSFCSKVEDVSSLGRGHTLKLSNCKRITDVSSLGNLFSLQLTCCSGVTNVSMLGRVKHLSINFCNGITDVASLSDLITLDISNCRYISDISTLGGVANLKCNQTHIEFFPSLLVADDVDDGDV
eukprot:m.165016 g.165016  ORF g.165016 m.165016 type:complete len:623 (+) comp13431_c2_seq2:85-1953(+)